MLLDVVVVGLMAFGLGCLERCFFLAVLEGRDEVKSEVGEVDVEEVEEVEDEKTESPVGMP